jgi:1-acylglycerone phosphate reductase
MLVNNAGRGLSGPSITASMADIQNLYATNVFGLMAVTQAFAPLLATTAARSSGFRPRIVNVGSVAGIRSIPWSGLYASTKAALASYSDALRLELKGLGIDVLVIARKF